MADGHAGQDAAAFVEGAFRDILLTRMPPALPDVENLTGERAHQRKRAFCMCAKHLPHPHACADLEPFAASIRKALCETFVLLDYDWSDQGDNAGERCGPLSAFPSAAFTPHPLVFVWFADTCPMRMMVSPRTLKI